MIAMRGPESILHTCPRTRRPNHPDAAHTTTGQTAAVPCVYRIHTLFVAGVYNNWTVCRATHPGMQWAIICPHVQPSCTHQPASSHIPPGPLPEPDRSTKHARGSATCKRCARGWPGDQGGGEGENSEAGKMCTAARQIFYTTKRSPTLLPVG